MQKERAIYIISFLLSGLLLTFTFQNCAEPIDAGAFDAPSETDDSGQLGSLTVTSSIAPTQPKVGDTILLTTSAKGGEGNYTYTFRKEGRLIQGGSSNQLSSPIDSTTDGVAYSVEVQDESGEAPIVEEITFTLYDEDGEPIPNGPRGGGGGPPDNSDSCRCISNGPFRFSGTSSHSPTGAVVNKSFNPSAYYSCPQSNVPLALVKKINGVNNVDIYNITVDSSRDILTRMTFRAFNRRDITISTSGPKPSTQQSTVITVTFSAITEEFQEVEEFNCQIPVNVF